MCMALLIVSPTAAEKGELNEHPIGTGPYQFVSWTKNSDIQLRRLDGYWDKDNAGKPKDIIFYFIAKLIVCDEPVSALDVSIQAQVLNLLDDLKDELGLTYLFIAHGLNVVKHVSDRVGVMYLGRLMEVAQKNDLYHEPLCPYTQALLSAIPSPDPRLSRKRIILSGDVPSPIDPPEGCRFASRCFAKVGACDVAAPELREVAPGHLCACHRYENMAADDVRAVARRIQYEAARPTYGMGGTDANADPISSDPDTPDEAAEKGEELPV